MTDDRGVSVTVGYVLNLAIAAILVSALLMAGGSLIESQTEQVTHDELTVAGQQLAGDLASADRLARAGETETLTLQTDLPQRTAAGSYSITVAQPDGESAGHIELESTHPEVTVTVPLRSETPVENTTVTGGQVTIVYDNGEGVLEVQAS